MALELPDWLTDAFNLIGLPWPGIDEDQLHDWARSVRQFANDICDNSSQTNQAMQDLAGSSESAVLTGVARQYESHHRLLTELHGPMEVFAQALDYAADAVVAQKWIVIGAATALAAEFTATQIGAIFSLGADEAALPAEVISTREIVKFALKDLEAVVIGRLINWGATELSTRVNHSIVTLANDAWGMHMEAQGLKIAYEKVSGAARQLNGHADDAERLGSQAHGQNAGRTLTDNSGGGGWAEVINALKQGLLTVGEDLFKTLPATIAKVLRDLAGILQRLAARLKGADEEGNVAATGSAKPVAPQVGASPGAEPAPSGTGGRGPGLTADQNPGSELPPEIPRQFLDKLTNLERWLEDEQIPHAVFGSLAASAYIDQGRSLDFNRPHAHDPSERVPDIDLLIPRADLQRVRPYIEAVENSDFPVHVDTFWAECWVDLRPDAQNSYLTHRQLRMPIRTELFSPAKARLLGQEITTLDPRTLLGLYGTVGVLRKKDVPRVTGLIEAIATGAAPSRFTEQDSKVFDDFMRARKRRYPAFVVSKRAWAGLMGTLPAPAAQALKHYVGVPANEVRRIMNRGQRHDPGQSGP